MNRKALLCIECMITSSQKGSHPTENVAKFRDSFLDLILIGFLCFSTVTIIVVVVHYLLAFSYRDIQDGQHPPSTQFKSA